MGGLEWDETQCQESQRWSGELHEWELFFFFFAPYLSRLHSCLISSPLIPFLYIFFFFPATFHFPTNSQFFSRLQSTLFFTPCFSPDWITAGKLNILSTKERTNRQGIILPLKSWLLALLLTRQRYLHLWGQTGLVHEYKHVWAHTERLGSKIAVGLLYPNISTHQENLMLLLLGSLDFHSWITGSQAVLQRQLCVHMHIETQWCKQIQPAGPPCTHSLRGPQKTSKLHIKYSQARTHTAFITSKIYHGNEWMGCCSTHWSRSGWT